MNSQQAPIQTQLQLTSTLTVIHGKPLQATVISPSLNKGILFKIQFFYSEGTTFRSREVGEREAAGVVGVGTRQFRSNVAVLKKSSTR